MKFNNMKLQYFFVVLAMLMFCFMACKPDKEEQIPVTDITLNHEKLVLIPNETINLVAFVQPDNANKKNIIWESNNTKVATVNNKGLVTAIANGEAIITVTTQDNNKIAICNVNVDYRNHWIGSYNCEYIHDTYINMSEESWSDTIQEIIIDIIIIGDSSLYIVGKEEYEVKINNTGSFTGERRGLDGAFGSFENGNLEKDSVFLQYVRVSPGSTSMIFYYGEKL